jgi:hypothetical protein
VGVRVPDYRTINCTLEGMRAVTLPLPKLGFVIATRAMLAAGLALVFGSRLPPEQRRRVGLTLVAIGAAATVPAVWWISRSLGRPRPSQGVEYDPRLKGATRFPRKGDDIL